jgi:flagellar biosynthesis/type III secretory pathway M-ring protein FliF/YscJ
MTAVPDPAPDSVTAQQTRRTFPAWLPLVLLLLALLLLVVQAILLANALSRHQRDRAEATATEAHGPADLRQESRE